MKNYTKLSIATFVLFLLVNTNYFWEGQLGLWGIPVTFALIIYALILAGLLIPQLVAACKEKFANKARLLNVLFQVCVLASVYVAPTGLVDFDRLSGKDVLVADREGVASCHTTLKLKDNGTFIQRQVCFGVTEVKGRYAINGDTVFFKDIAHNRLVDSFYSYGILKSSPAHDKNKVSFDLYEYYNSIDTVGYPLFVSENNLQGWHVSH